MYGSKNTLWVLSHVVSITLASALFIQWRALDAQWDIVDPQLVSEDSVQSYLEKEFQDSVDFETLEQIKTGIFLQSLKFYNSSEVHITGYIWQQFPLSVYKDTSDEDLQPGFILPEQIQTGSDISPLLAYRLKSEYGEVLGWYVEATLKQGFDYSHYPFDHKTVWIRLWAKDFSRNVVLAPDYSAYDDTGEASGFGIEENIVLGGWVLENSYFSYKGTDYDTNFGISDYSGQKNFPELYYNVVIKRRFDNVFIVYLLPLFLVAVLLFSALLTVSDSPKSSELIGFSTSGFLGMCSALFFVVMVAHIHLREQFASSGLVYLETYYLIAYLMLALSTVNAYLFAIRPKTMEALLLYGDNLIPKITFWPMLLVLVNVTTFQYL